MSNVNIRRDVQDSFYRYKMPKLLAKIEGRGNGIKTLIPNMSAISLALSRPPTYATKYFGFELGALVTIDEKTDRYIVNGAHGAEDLAKILDVFIKKYVLCGDCQNPETDLIVKRDDISRECRVCGAKTSVESNHRLSTFIVKNPPPRAHADKYKKYFILNLERVSLIQKKNPRLLKMVMKLTMSLQDKSTRTQKP